MTMILPAPGGTYICICICICLCKFIGHLYISVCICMYLYICTHIYIQICKIIKDDVMTMILPAPGGVYIYMHIFM
jgi:hypothetical protein